MAAADTCSVTAPPAAHNWNLGTLLSARWYHHFVGFGRLGQFDFLADFG